MEKFKNKSEKFYREIRSIEIYPAASVPYIDNFKGIFPNPDDCLYQFEIIPETFNRKIPTKTQNGNYFYEIDLNFSLLDLSATAKEKYQNNFNKKYFAVVLVSNVNKMLLGNDREKLKVEFIDGQKDDNSGTDEDTLAISGSTIIPPKIKDL